MTVCMGVTVRINLSGCPKVSVGQHLLAVFGHIHHTFDILAYELEEGQIVICGVHRFFVCVSSFPWGWGLQFRMGCYVSVHSSHME